MMNKMKPKTIHIITTPQEIKDFFEMKEGISKNYFYSKEIKHRMYETSDIYEDNDKLCFAYNMFKIAKNKNKYYNRPSERKGFTYDKKTKKARAWFGTSPRANRCFLYFFHNYKIDWFKDQYLQFLTNGLLSKIISKKITNPKEFFRQWLKVQRIKTSHTLLFKAVESYDYGTFPRGVLIFASQYSENIDVWLKKIIKKDKEYIDTHTIVDMLEQVSIFNEKINFNWSKKRFLEEHKKLSMRIMGMEVDGLKDVAIEYHSVPKLPKEIKLLNTQKKVFAEGASMSHCVYSNYWPKISKKEYMALHVEYNGEHATMGLRSNGGKVAINQLSGQRNKLVSGELREFVHQWIEKTKDQIQFKEHAF